MAEELTAFLTIPDPLGDETEDAVDEAFGELEVRLGGIVEAVGWHWMHAVSGALLYERPLA